MEKGIGVNNFEGNRGANREKPLENRAAQEQFAMGQSETERSGPEEYFAKQFALEQRAWEQYSPLTLAYIGDAVYDLLIRTVLVKRTNCQTGKLHSRASSLVKAATQAEMIASLQQYLTKEEQGVYRRGHNAKPYNTAKNATRREYLEATGFEALIGYLYLKGDYRRMIDLVRLGLEESGHAL